MYLQAKRNIWLSALRVALFAIALHTQTHTSEKRLLAAFTRENESQKKSLEKLEMLEQLFSKRDETCAN